MRFSHLLTSAAATLTLAAPAANAAELVTNGGFELPASSGSVTTLASGLTGWTIGSGNIDIVRSPYTTFEGTQALDLVGSGTSTGSISQMLSTQAGQSYKFSFAYTNNTDTGSLLSARFALNGTATLLSGSISHQGGTNGVPNWTIYNGVFKADSANTLLSFYDATGQYNQGIFLDAVSVAGVPEASTWALMILGFGLVGAAMRRRQVKLTYA